MKSLVNYALFKEQLKRFWAIAALSVLFYILFVISPLWSGALDRGGMYAVNYYIGIITMKHPVVIMSGIIVPFATVLTTFSYLFQPKSTTLMHSFPLNKKQLFFTNVAAGLALIAVPILIMCALLLKPIVCQLPEMSIGLSGEAGFVGYMPSLPVEIFPSIPADGTVVNTLPTIAGFLFRALLTNFFYYAVFLLAVSVAGNAVVSFLISGLLPVLPCGFLLLGYLTGYFFLFGFTAFSFNDTLLKTFTFSNPVMLSGVFNYYYPTSLLSSPDVAPSNLSFYYGVYILIAAILFGLSYWCYRIRKQERAGDSVVFVSLRNVLVFLSATGGMVFLGAFLLSVLNIVAALYAGFVVGFIITYFIAQMIAEKTFNVLYKAKDIVKYGGVMAVLFAAVIAAARFDVLGYQTYSPTADEVYGVYLQSPYAIYNNDRRDKNNGYALSLFVTDRQIITDTLAAHKRIIDERYNLRSVFLRNMAGNYSYSAENPIREQSFLFLLANGEYVSRSYILPWDFMESSGMIELMSEEEVILSPYYSFRNTDKISAVTLDYRFFAETNGESEYDKMIIESSMTYAEPVRVETPEEISGIVEEIKKDLVITERERLRNQQGDEMRYQSAVFGNADYMITDGYAASDYFGLDSHENVDRWLDDRGLTPESVQQ